MLKKILIIGFLILLSSCATIWNSKSCKVHITTNAYNAEVKLNDSTTFTLPNIIKLNRSDDDLQVKLTCDSTTKNFILKPYLSPEFIFGNIVFTWGAPIGYLVDIIANNRKFTYGNYLFLDMNSTDTVVRSLYLKPYITKKGQIDFLLSLPWVNRFQLQPQNEPKKINTGFFGIATGLEYYYTEKKFLNLTFNAMMDYLVPFPVGVDYWGEHESMSSSYTSLTDNFKVNRFSFGYGINYSKNNWSLMYEGRWDSIPKPHRDPVSKTSRSLGLTFNGYYNFGKVFCMGLIYRPTLLRVYPKVEYQYEHLISMDFMWKMKMVD